ncbi:nitrate regulatory protein [Venatoribacter cucullus]|nr:nitrate regulatory protein [Venatoribacter cucullus]
MLNTPSDRSNAVAYFLTLGRQQELSELEQFSRTSMLVIAISNLLHQLQYERGLSNLFLGSQGVRGTEELQNQWSNSDTQLKQLQQALNNLLPEQGLQHLPARWLRRLGYALHSLERLPQLRADIQQQRLHTSAAIKAYSELVQSLLAVIFETASQTSNEAMARILVAMFNLMQGKELAGQERACGAAGFAARQFDPALRERITQLIDRQDRCFHIFCDYANDEALQAWARVLQGDFQLEFERLRRLVLTASPASMAVEEYDIRWFHCCSARLDALKQVEEILETRLLQMAQQALLQIRELSAAEPEFNHDLQRAAFDDVPTFALYVSHSETDDPFSGPDDDMAHNLSKPVVELIEAQGKRLKSLHGELDAARTELHERKLIDRAKRELMQRRQMTEQEAYAFLRRMAMNQNRRLVDVANNVLNMTELL